MATELIKGNFYEAYCYNKALFITFPIIAVVFLNYEIRFVLYGKRELLRIEKCVLWTIACLLILFGFIRNVI